MKKKALILVSILTLASLIGYYCYSSTHDKETEQDKPEIVNEKDKPWNISIFLDLSDRLTRQLTPSQAERDMTLIRHVTGKVKERIVKQKIIGSKDRIKVFFYPSPNISEITLLSKNLELDMGNMPLKEKRSSVIKFEDEFSASLKQIYNKTLAAKQWVGSDIWGFFNKQIDTYCIKPTHRNVLIILTDGYIFHVNNKQKVGDAYSYILPQTLSVPKSSLIVSRKGLKNLEVMFLEVNPYDPKTEPKMESVITDWLHAMDVQHSIVAETDIPENTKLYIDNFLGE